MPGQLHQSVVQNLTAIGYRTQGAMEFARLAYYLDEELGIDARDELLGLFASDKPITPSKASNIARSARSALPDADDAPTYEQVRDDIPAPKGIPDAWRYQPSAECEGRMAIEFIEVFDTCRTKIEKVAEYGRVFDHYSRMQFVLHEIDANDGAVARHDPLHAFAVMLYVQRYGKSKEIMDVIRKAYAKHLASGEITVKESLLCA